MIEINLSTVKKPLGLANIGGLDLSKLNVKLVVLAFFFLYIPDFFLVGNLEELRVAADGELQAMILKKNKLTKKVNALKEFDKQVQQLKRRELQLTEKLEVVKSILTTKRNPWNILVYIAKNIPPEIWLTQIEFKEDELTFRGLSLDYANQGVFLDNLKKSIFFDKKITYSKIPLTTSATDAEKSMAPFEVKARITRFE
jgi:Tfp pilus assembly protein PilN